MIPFITKKEMFDYIMKQPDDRPIDMLQCNVLPNSTECGCLMVEYTKDVFGITDASISTGHTGIYAGDNMDDVAELAFDMYDFVKNGFENESKTFGELKKCLKKQQ
jgi:hypothetical protein